ncbi:hypothetical protein D9756_005402 [Leucocoprinus leucothites]|uniref:Calcineurin-like phosphoesterase domain-containing protein n=1 Tax=Leucocoprinus leucothites TaxID=201217 RepID=A0A8H5D7G7_9AGAR|nr:hypothetical protein D9756_005402 [Leucoagaricus leucothites]
MNSTNRSGVLLRSLLYSPALTTNILRFLWVLLICWGELGVYFWSLSTCKWPVPKASEKAAGKALHVLLVSDTQISVPSLSSKSTPSFLHPRAFLTDKFLKKSWYVTRRLDPQVVFFMGDMLSHGKTVENEAQFTENFQKFISTFTLKAPTAVYYLPGNNDVGMGIASAPSKGIRRYYQNHFGPLNNIINLNNHTFFALDAPDLVDEDYQRNARGAAFDRWEPIPGGTVEAVRNVAAENHHPLILLSHIPLYRPDGAYCGPLRESGAINRGVGHGYQNTLGKQTTAFLMEALEPSIVFTGDNRDYCEYFHNGTSFNAEDSIPEITVKSFSPAPQIRRPGFQLLSIVDPTNLEPSQRPQSLTHRPCLLPDQRIVLIGYVGWAIATLCILLTLNVQRIRQFRLSKPINPSLTPSPTRSHQTSPLLQVSNHSLSPIWSPHTLFPPVTPQSSRSQIPSIFRTPMAPATPTFRASSRPMTPQGFNESPMLSPQLMPPMHDDEDAMFPDQYTIHRDVRRVNDEEWTPVGREDYFDSDPMDDASEAEYLEDSMVKNVCVRWATKTNRLTSPTSIVCMLEGTRGCTRGFEGCKPEDLIKKT